jgi:hypothetical protein
MSDKSLFDVTTRTTMAAADFVFGAKADGSEIVKRTLGNFTKSLWGGDVDNTRLGFESLNNLSGYSTATENAHGYNTAFGVAALRNNVYDGSSGSGHYSCAFGYDALHDQTSGYNNVGMGLGAGLNIGAGHGNTLLGAFAAYHSVGGNFNVAIGDSALGSTSAMNDANTAVGASTLSGVTGPGNAAFGANAGGACTSAQLNTLMGYLCCDQLVTGDNNIVGGYRAGHNYTGDESYNIVFGNLGVVGDAGIIRIGESGLHSNAYLAGLLHLEDSVTSTAPTNVTIGVTAVDAWLIVKQGSSTFKFAGWSNH